MECALRFNFGVCRMFNKCTKVAGRCPNYTNCCVRLVLESPPPLTPSSSHMFLCPLSILSPLFLSSHLLPFLPFSPPQLPLLSHPHILFPFPPPLTGPRGPFLCCGPWSSTRAVLRLERSSSHRLPLLCCQV